MCDGIRRLATAEGDATIGVGFLVTQQNWSQAGQAAELASALGADYLQLRPTIMYDQADPTKAAEGRAWLIPLIPYFERLAQRYPNIVVDIDRFRMYRDWSGHGYTTCWWSALQTVITPNGKVWTCVNKREHPGAELGDLTQETFADIWARRPLAKVGADCRVLCRGHIANTEIEAIMAPREHAAFV